MKSIATFAPTFYDYIISVLVCVCYKVRVVGDPGVVTRSSTAIHPIDDSTSQRKVRLLDGEIQENLVHSSGKGLNNLTL